MLRLLCPQGKSVLVQGRRSTGCALEQETEGQEVTGGRENHVILTPFWIRSRRWAEHVALMGETRIVHVAFRQEILRKISYKWEYNIKMLLENKMAGLGVDSSYSA
jgi:hypothetical protein